MSKEFNILIVEDELLIAEMIKEMLLELKYRVAAIAKNHEEANIHLSGPQQIDMAILDINLGEKRNGIDVARDIQAKYKIPYIYLTSYSDPQTINKAATTTPAAYLLKPFAKNDLYATIEMIKARESQKSLSIIVKEGDLSVKIESKDILHIKSDNNYLELVTTDRKYVVRNSLEKFLVEFPDPNLIRIHRSYAVNILSVAAINGQYLMIGNEKFPLSRKYKDDAISHFSKADR